MIARLLTFLLVVAAAAATILELEVQPPNGEVHYIRLLPGMPCPRGGKCRVYEAGIADDMPRLPEDQEDDLRAFFEEDMPDQDEQEMVLVH